MGLSHQKDPQTGRDRRDDAGGSGTAQKLIQGVVLNTWSESAAVMVCSNVCRGRR